MLKEGTVELESTLMSPEALDTHLATLFLGFLCLPNSNDANSNFLWLPED